LRELDRTREAFEELTKRIDDQWISEWKKLEQDAMENRGEQLRIYDITTPKGLLLTVIQCLVTETYDSNRTELRRNPVRDVPTRTSSRRSLRDVKPFGDWFGPRGFPVSHSLNSTLKGLPMNIVQSILNHSQQVIEKSICF
jgi:hypothetical protein